MFSLLLFTACGEKDGSDTKSCRVNRYTFGLRKSVASGVFDSSQQAQEDPTYYDVSLTACAVSVEGIETPTLYIEQALSDKLNQPYRQRIYVLSQVDENVVKSEIYVLDNPNAYIGTCAEDEFFAQFNSIQ